MREKILNYTIEQLLWAGDTALIYQIIDDKTAHTLKVLKEEYPSLSAVNRLEREWEIAQSWQNLSGILKPERLLKQGHVPFLIMENFSGAPLRKWLIPQAPLHITLLVGLHLSAVLMELHRKDIIHGSLTTDLLLFDPEKGVIKLAEYSQISLPGDPLDIAHIPSLSCGQLAYAAPERSGRLHSAIDRRCDIYSWGAILYECACGIPPFSGKNPLTLIHTLLTDTAPDVTKLATRLPPSLAAIIMRCLSKAADQRYQSAKELYDLMKWHIEIFQEKGEQALYDQVPPMPQPLCLTTHKLYGREGVEKNIVAAIAASETHSQWLALVGAHGMGKSSLLIQQYHAALVQHPYSTLYRAEAESSNISGAAVRGLLKGLIKKVLSSETPLWEELREQLAAQCEPHKEILLPFLPELSSLLNAPYRSSAVPPEMSHEVYPELSSGPVHLPPYPLIHAIVQVLASAGTPLLLFVDDIDQIDLDSLTFLANLLHTPPSRHLFLLSSQTAAKLPIPQTGKKLPLLPLTIKEISAYLFDLFNGALNNVSALSKLIWHKTKGLPHAIKEFISELLHNEIIWFNYREQQWKWNRDLIRKKSLTDNAIALSRTKISELGEPCQSLLFLAAQLGIAFDLRLLAHIAKMPLEQCQKALYPALSTGLLEKMGCLIPSTPSAVPCKPLPADASDLQYKFSHPLLLESAAALPCAVAASEASLDSLCRLQYEAGIYLLEHTSEDDFSEKIEQILFHLNNTLTSSTPQGAMCEAIFLADLNLKGCRHAKQMGHLNRAFEYITIARNLLSVHNWISHYSLAYEIYLESVEVAYLVRRFDQVEPLSAILLEHANSNLDKGRLYTWKVNYYTNSSRPKEAIAAGLTCLRLFDINLPENPVRWKILLRLACLTVRMGLRGFQQLCALPTMKETTSLFLMEHMAALCTPSFIANKPLMCLLSLVMIELSLEKGNCSHSSFAYTTYGLTVASAFDAYRHAFAFGELGIYLANYFDSDFYRCRTNFCMGLFFNHWLFPRKECSPYLNASYLAGASCNDVLFTSYLSVNYGFADGLFYKNIGQAAAYPRRFQDEVIHSKNPLAINYNIIEERVCEALQSREGLGYVLSTQSFNETAFVQYLREDSGLQVPYQLYVSFKGMLLFLFGQYRAAHDLFTESKGSREFIKTIRPEFDIVFYEGMTAAYLLRDEKSLEKKEKKLLWDTLQRCRRRFKMWKKNCEVNYGARSALLDAQAAALSGALNAAENLCNEAIKSAQNGESIHDEAIANESLAILYLSEGVSSAAAAHLREAHYCFYRWGAVAKMRQLEQLFPQWLAPKHPKTSSLDAPFFSKAPALPAKSDIFKGMSYLTPLIYTSQAIAALELSGENLPPLLDIALHYAGGDSSALFHKDAGHWTIVCEAKAAGMMQLHLPPQAYHEDSHDALAALTPLNSAIDNKELLTIFTTLSDTPPRCWDLVIPFLYDASPPFALYLNSCRSPPFEKDLLSAMRLLIPQGAMAGENLLLNERLTKITSKLQNFHTRLENYSQRLEQQVEERTKELQEKNIQLQQAFQQTQLIQQRIVEQEKFATIGALAQDISLEIQEPLSHINSLLEQVQAPLLLMYRSTADSQSNAAAMDTLQQNIEKISEHSKRTQAVIDLLKISSATELEDQKLLSLEALLSAVISCSQELFMAQTGRPLLVERLGPTLESYPIASYPDLRHALVNILDNSCYAMKCKIEATNKEHSSYTPTLAVAVSVGVAVDTAAAAETRSDGAGAGDWIEITLSDNGIGIPGTYQKQVFVPFFTTKAAGIGHGLGLSTAYDIITQRCKGSLTFLSKEGEFTSFTLRLPTPS